MRGDSGTRGFAARSGRWGCLFMLAPALTCFSFCPVVPAQEQGDGVALGGGDETAAGQQGKRIFWAVCMRFSLFSERSKLLSITLCFLDDANEQDVARSMGHGGLG